MKPIFGSWGIVAAGVIPVLVLSLAVFFYARSRKPPAGTEPTSPYPHFVFAKILDPMMPMERGAKYEEPLGKLLEQARLGQVVGGGTQMDTDNTIEWIGVDIELANLDSALEFARKSLLELGAPKGSQMEYSVGEKDYTVPIHPE